MGGEKADGVNYRYHDARPSHAHAYLLPALEQVLAQTFHGESGPRRVFDLGCGNGAVAARLAGLGYEMCGVDPSEEGIAIARRELRKIRL